MSIQNQPGIGKKTPPRASQIFESKSTDASSSGKLLDPVFGFVIVFAFSFLGMFPALRPSCELLRKRNLTAMAAMSLDLSVILIVLMVWALYFVLKKSFFDPINDILTTREAASQGALEEAKSQLAVVDKKSTAYAETVKAARLESYRQQEAFRAKAVQERAQIIAQGRQGGEQLIGSARKEIQSQVASAKSSLQSEVAGIADGIVKGILR